MRGGYPLFKGDFTISQLRAKAKAAGKKAPKNIKDMHRSDWIALVGNPRSVSNGPATKKAGPATKKAAKKAGPATNPVKIKKALDAAIAKVEKFTDAVHKRNVAYKKASDALRKAKNTAAEPAADVRKANAAHKLNEARVKLVAAKKDHTKAKAAMRNSMKVGGNLNKIRYMRGDEAGIAAKVEKRFQKYDVYNDQNGIKTWSELDFKQFLNTCEDVAKIFYFITGPQIKYNPAQHALHFLKIPFTEEQAGGLNAMLNETNLEKNITIISTYMKDKQCTDDKKCTEKQITIITFLYQVLWDACCDMGFAAGSGVKTFNSRMKEINTYAVNASKQTNEKNVDANTAIAAETLDKQKRCEIAKKNIAEILSRDQNDTCSDICQNVARN
jgi:hypothetical protein